MNLGNKGRRGVRQRSEKKEKKKGKRLENFEIQKNFFPPGWKFFPGELAAAENSLDAISGKIGWAPTVIESRCKSNKIITYLLNTIEFIIHRLICRQPNLHSGIEFEFDFPRVIWRRFQWITCVVAETGRFFVLSLDPSNVRSSFQFWSAN